MVVEGSQVVSVILFRGKILVGSNEEDALKSRSERINSKALCFALGQGWRSMVGGSLVQGYRREKCDLCGGGV